MLFLLFLEIQKMNETRKFKKIDVQDETYFIESVTRGDIAEIKITNGVKVYHGKGSYYNHTCTYLAENDFNLLYTKFINFKPNNV